MSEKPAAPAVPAATILLVRNGTGAGLEVFMIVRHHQIDFASGALVFPGGKANEGDKAPGLRALTDGSEGLDDLQHFMRVAAIREAFEESGILLARRVGETALLTAADLKGLDHYRRPLDKGELVIGDFLAREKLRLALDRLVPFAHWVTPLFMPKRFDTFFFVAEAPSDQAGLHDGRESVDSVWITPAGALAAAARKERTIIFPTRMNIELLGRAKTAGEALQAARARRIVTVEPWVSETGGKRMLNIPKEAGYAVSEEPLESMMG